MRRVFLLSACISFSAWGWGPPKEMPPTSVEVFAVKESTVVQSIDAVGVLRADQAIILKPEISGRVEAFHFLEGKPVKKGDLLISFDSSTAKAQLKEAQANLQLSNLNLKRTQELFSRKLISATDKDNVVAKQKIDEAKVALAQAAMDKTQLVAPFDGVVGLREVSVGDVVSAGQKLMSVVALDPMKVDFSVSEVSLDKLKVDQVVNVNVKTFPDKTFTGKIMAIDPFVDGQTHSVSARAVIDNYDGLLSPGLFAQVKLILSSQDNALMIPEQAIVPQGKQQMVYRIHDGVVALVPVEIGVRQAGQVEVLKGLKVGDRIVTAGQIKLHEGAKVVDAAQTNQPPPSK
jgi:membrane fusion protein (multidrug efflux system)